MPSNPKCCCCKHPMPLVERIREDQHERLQYECNRPTCPGIMEGNFPIETIIIWLK